ncbi:MAG: hypothetical protein ACI8UQ_000085 [Bacteroidia bacterium]|jgi:hypothetical protein
MYAELITRQQTVEYLLLKSVPTCEVLEVPCIHIGNSNGFSITAVFLALSIGVLFFHESQLVSRLVKTLLMRFLKKIVE